MFIIEMLLLAVLGFVTFKVTTYIVKVTKLNAFIVYLIIGIIFGVSGFGLLNNEKIMEAMAEYNELISLVALMLGAGLSLNFKVIKNAGSKVAFLSIVPLYVETIVMGFVLTFLVNLIPIGFTINVLEGMLIAVLVGPTQPSVVFASLFRRMGAKKTSVNNAESTFLLSSVVENFTGIPVIFALLSIIMGLELSGGSVDAIGVAKNVGIILLAIVISAAIVFGLGTIYAKLVKGYANSMTEKKQMTMFVIGSLIVNVIIVILSGPLTALSILFGLMFGMALNLNLDNGVREKCQHITDEIFMRHCAPIIFLSVGASIELSKLLSLNLVIVASVFYCLSVLLKNIVMRIYLKKQGFTAGEMNYIGFSYLAKGVGAINVVGVLTAIIASTQLETDVLLSYIAIIEILISFVIYTSFIKKYEDKWLDDGNK